MITKSTNAHKSIKVPCIINAIFLLHVSDTPQGGALQRMAIPRYQKSFQTNAQM